MWFTFVLEYQQMFLRTDTVIYLEHIGDGRFKLSIPANSNKSGDINKQRLFKKAAFFANPSDSSPHAVRRVTGQTNLVISDAAETTAGGMSEQTTSFADDGSISGHLHNVFNRMLTNRNYSCPTLYNSTHVRPHVSNPVICNNANSKKYDLVYFTTMYYSKSSLYMFKNTLRVIASLQERFNLKAVMFIENPGAFVSANETKFIQYACNLGWTVLLAPHCNEYGYPVFKSMFDVAMSTWDAEWYGYSNADMLFDASLMKTIKFIQSKGDVIDIPMLVGRRYNTEVSVLHTV